MRAPEAGQARRHLLLGLLVVGEGDHGLALVAAVGQQVAVALGEDAGLARAGGGDDAGRARRRGPTAASWSGASAAAGRDRGRLRARARRARRSRGGRPRRRRAARAAAPAARRRSTPGCRRASTTSAVTALGGAEAGRLAGPPPDRLAGRPRVVAVGPHEEVQPVEPGLEAGPQLPQRGREGLGRAERAGVDRQLDHDRVPLGPRRRGAR